MIDVVERFSPEGRAAIEEIKAFIRETAPVDVVHERALLLAGLREDDVEAGIAKFSQELAEGFAKAALPEKFRAGFVIAAAEILREKLAELQTRGTGHA
jgi:hypothetical protein